MSQGGRWYQGDDQGVARDIWWELRAVHFEPRRRVVQAATQCTGVVVRQWPGEPRLMLELVADSRLLGIYFKNWLLEMQVGVIFVNKAEFLWRWRAGMRKWKRSVTTDYPFYNTAAAARSHVKTYMLHKYKVDFNDKLRFPQWEVCWKASGGGSHTQWENGGEALKALSWWRASWRWSPSPATPLMQEGLQSMKPCWQGCLRNIPEHALQCTLDDLILSVLL